MKGSIHRTVAQVGSNLEDFSMRFHGVFYLFEGFRLQLVKSQIDRAAFKRKGLVFQKAVLSDKEFKAVGVVRQAIAGGEGFVRKNKILHFSIQSVFISATGIKKKPSLARTASSLSFVGYVDKKYPAKNKNIEF